MSTSIWNRLGILTLGLAALICVPLARKSAMAEPTPVATAAPSAARFFEMRTYHAAAGKLDALHARFRDHTTALFSKHGMTSIGYWTPADGDTAKNTLVYILAYPSRDAAKASWKAFQADPQWQKAKAASEVDGKLVDKVDSVYMNSTDYSPIK